ncbi:MAG: DegV family protein [Candidatus Eremiobacteraeota bacterium]|nr:DegV family protein [Candidatus Eremiobacteraeota bacterium]
MIKIVTDSTSDIEPARAGELGVDVVPLFVLWGDKSYRDYIDLSRSEFYERLKTEPVLPTTSQPTAKMFEDAFEPHVAAGDDVLCITISSKLSGTMNAARAAAQRFDGKVRVVDSESAAGGLGMMVMHANELAHRGTEMDTIVAFIEREKETQRLFACVPDLSFLNRTGRIGKAKQLIGTLMKIVPVLSLKEGAVVPEAQVRTFSRAQQTMIDMSLANAPDIANARFLIMHTNAPELAGTVLEKLRECFGGIEPKLSGILEAGPVIGVHAGAGAVGVFSAQD